MSKSRFTIRRRDRPLLVVCICTVLLSVAGISQPLSADVAEPRRAPALEEILVTAQRREESIRDVPIAMQAFTGDSLRELGVVDTRDLANVIPGFTYVDSGDGNPIYTIRGVGFEDASRSANSSVGVYIDQAPIPYSYMTQGANVDLNRIEVLKGPQGTLYGRNTTGGAINYIPNKPAESLEFGIEAEYGRFEQYSLEGYVSGPVTRRLSARLALRAIEANEGWQKSLTRPGDRLGEKDKQAGRATLEWDPVDTLRLNFTVDWWRDLSEPQAPQPIGLAVQNNECREQSRELGFPPEQCLHPDVRNHPVVESEDNRLADWAPGIPWALDDEMLMPVLRAYWDVTERIQLALIASYSDFETGHTRIPLSGLSVINTEMTQKSTDTTAHSIELRADGQLFEGRLSWLVGVFTSSDDVEDFTLLRTDTNSGSFNFIQGVQPLADHVSYIGTQKAESDAYFANVEYAMASYLTLALGMRYTDEIRKFGGCTIDPPENQEGGKTGFSPIFNARSLAEGGSGGTGPGQCITLDEETRNPSFIRKELEEENMSGKASVTWTPSDNHLLYLSYSRGFKSGSFPIIPTVEGAQYEPVTQERVDAIELGGKTGWFNGRLQVDFSLFDYDYRDKQLSSFFIDPTFGPGPKLFNVPKTKVQGAELEIRTSPLIGLEVSVAASYLDTEIEQFVGINARGETINFSGNELAFAPDIQSTLLVSYKFPIPLFSSLEGTASVDYIYSAGATSAIENDPSFKIPSYELVNARVGIGDVSGNWDVTAWVRNATNEFYQLNQPQFGADTVMRFTGMPQTAGIKFSYRYF